MDRADENRTDDYQSMLAPERRPHNGLSLGLKTATAIWLKDGSAIVDELGSLSSDPEMAKAQVMHHYLNNDGKGT